MSIPENWEEELMLHSWKMMKVDRCKSGHDPNYGSYHFPNGIRIHRFYDVEVEIEFADLIEPLLKHWNYDRKTEKKEGIVRFNLRAQPPQRKLFIRGNFEDLLWDLYSLELKK